MFFKYNEALFSLDSKTYHKAIIIKAGVTAVGRDRPIER